MTDTDTSAEAIVVIWKQMAVMEPEWFEAKAGNLVLQIYTNWAEDAWVLLNASGLPEDAEPSDMPELYRHGSLAEAKLWGMSWLASALSAERDALQAENATLRAEVAKGKMQAVNMAGNVVNPPIVLGRLAEARNAALEEAARWVAENIQYDHSDSLDQYEVASDIRALKTTPATKGADMYAEMVAIFRDMQRDVSGNGMSLIDHIPSVGVMDRIYSVLGKLDKEGGDG